MEPLISIIVPAYNIESYLGRCLDSIVGQTYQNIEIIVVDDGSVDDTGKIADQYAKQYPGCVKCIHIENGGVTNARLIGTAAATGEWIGYVDGDDWIEADMYQRLLDNALKYHADISHCGYQTVVNDVESINYFYNTERVVQQNRATGLRDLLSGTFVEPGLCNKLFHKSLFHSLLHDDVLDRTLKINEDLLMNFILFKEAKTAIYEDFCPYHYMTRSTSATRSEFKAYKVLDPVKVRKWILEHVDSELTNIAWNKYLVCCYNAYSVIYNKSGMELESKELKETLKSNKEKRKFLSKREQMKLIFILYMPGVYNAVYRFYEKHFQRKVYE